MISRARCREIAREWKIAKAIEEQQRRLSSARATDHTLEDADRRAAGRGPLTECEEQERQEQDLEHRRKLVHLSTEALLMGVYDPPPPKIPPFWRRWFMDDWTPPDPAPGSWSMYTGE